MLEWLIAGSVALLCLSGIVLTALRLPGTWLIVLVGAGYIAWSAHAPGWWLAGALLAAAIVGEGLEFAASLVTAGRAGANRRATWGGLIGGFVGMSIFSLPVPVLGTIFGGLAGCFLGAAIGQYSGERQIRDGARVGFASAIGYVLGLVAKMGIAFAMAGLLAGVAIVGLIRGTPVQSLTDMQAPMPAPQEPEAPPTE
ncbi:MAG: DUF456 domain-containing protein [Alphaproteobacteria bacterium]